MEYTLVLLFSACCRPFPLKPHLGFLGQKQHNTVRQIIICIFTVWSWVIRGTMTQHFCFLDHPSTPLGYLLVWPPSFHPAVWLVSQYPKLTLLYCLTLLDLELQWETIGLFQIPTSPDNTSASLWYTGYTWFTDDIGPGTKHDILRISPRLEPGLLLLDNGYQLLGLVTMANIIPSASWLLCTKLYFLKVSLGGICSLSLPKVWTQQETQTLQSCHG